MNKKRIRSVNWDEEEKQLLRYMLRDHVHVIENKTINTKTIKLKNKVWEDVFKRFNELNGRHRSIFQLKIQWKTMKLNARKRRKLKREPIEAPPTPSNDAGLKTMTFVDSCINDNINQATQQIDCIEEIDNIDAQAEAPKMYAPLRVSKDIFKDTTQIETNMDTLSEKKDHTDHVSTTINHIKMLKEEEYRRRLEMAEEEHSLKIAIQIEKLKSATLEREILELKKAREESLNTTKEQHNEEPLNTTKEPVD